MDQRQNDVDQRGAGERPVDQTEHRSEQPAAAARGEEGGVVAEGEDLPEQEVQQVADRLGAHPVGGDGGAQQERQVDAGQSQLAGGAQGGGEHDRAGEPARERTPDGHRATRSPIARAALINARWLSACGRLPRKSPVPGSISSLYRPTSLASATARSMRSAARSTCPPLASASASQNEQATNAPSAPDRPSSPR